MFENPVTAESFSKFYLAQPDQAIEQYKLMKLAWDLVGTEFGSRHTQYEMFYAGPTHVTRGRLGYYFDWKLVDQEAERCLAAFKRYDNAMQPSSKYKAKIAQR